jgi:hypothetical protein
MNKKIKIIDLINMQYKNEKMPKNIRIKYSLVFDYYTYNEEIKWYETADKTTILDVFQKLDYEVEILEDNTEEIEEIPAWRLATQENDYEAINDTLDLFGNKINELVKTVNQIRKDLNK